MAWCALAKNHLPCNLAFDIFSQPTKLLYGSFKSVGSVITNLQSSFFEQMDVYAAKKQEVKSTYPEAICYEGETDTFEYLIFAGIFRSIFDQIKVFSDTESVRSCNLSENLTCCVFNLLISSRTSAWLVEKLPSSE